MVPSSIKNLSRHSDVVFCSNYIIGSAVHLAHPSSPLSPAGDGEIQIDELVDNMDVLIKYSVDGAKLQDAFQKLDLNGDGFIRQDDGVAMRAPPRRPLVARLVSVCD